MHFVNVTDGTAVENLSAHPTRKIIVRIQYGALLKSKWRIRNIKDMPTKWILSLSRAMQEASCHWDLSRRSLWNWQMLEKTSRIFEDIINTVNVVRKFRRNYKWRRKNYWKRDGRRKTRNLKWLDKVCRIFLLCYILVKQR